VGVTSCQSFSGPLAVLVTPEGGWIVPKTVVTLEGDKLLSMDA
jgi:hypothetical protein